MADLLNVMMGPFMTFNERFGPLILREGLPGR